MLQQGAYALIFEGAQDSSPETLRRLRAVLVGELSLTVEEARRILESPPAPIRIAETEADLKPVFDLITNAGGRVQIVQPKGSESASKNEDPPSDQGFEFTMELDLSDEDAPPRPREPDPAEHDPAIGSEVNELLQELESKTMVEPVKRNVEELISRIAAVPKTAEPLNLNPSPIAEDHVSAGPSTLKAILEPVSSEIKGESAAHQSSDKIEDVLNDSSNKLPLEVPEAGAAAVEEPYKAGVTRLGPVRRSRKKYTQEIAISILISLILLAAAQIVTRPRRAMSANFANLQAALINLANTAATSTPEETPLPAPVPHYYAGRAEGDKADGEISFISFNEKAIKAHVELSTASPPELTPEEIVRNQIKRPWVYKIEASEWHFQNTGTGYFGTSPATVYIEHRGFRQRYVGQMTLRLILTHSRSAFEGTLTIVLGKLASNVEDQDVLFNIHTDYSLKYTLMVKGNEVSSASAPSPAPKA